VVDFGTATKLEAVSREGVYLGGAILPGLEISAQALLSRAEKIREIDWTPPERAIGRSTMEALRSGFVFGFVGQAEALLRRFQEEMEGEACVITTGGLAPRLMSASPLLTNYNPNLTLEGVRLLYSYQREP
jgi:type III pantothenate kinase